MKILFAAAEAEPFSKVGGLADVAAALPRRLKEIGHDVRVVTPGHASALPLVRDAPMRRLGAEFDIAAAEGAGGVPVEVVCNDSHFAREAIYGEPDDLLRYQYFCHAVVAMLQEDDWRPDILHLNDWHAAPLAFALRSLAWSLPSLRAIASVFTIHNLRYRGPDHFNDFLAQAIYYSDEVTTVSPTYAREILTRDFGEGLDPLLRMREENLTGILNGLDYDYYNPRLDSALEAPFDLATLHHRPKNRAALLSELEFEPSRGPVVGMIARLTEQKGLDIVMQALPTMAALGAMVVVLGLGDDALVSELNSMAAAWPLNLRFLNRFDERLARRIYAGADIFLMPSRYEPCGLGQLIAMRYGAVTVGRRTGGIADTIVDADEHPDTATGFLFDEFSVVAFVGALERAVRAFRRPRAWRRLQTNGLTRDYSWRASATHYVEAYVSALRARGIVPFE